MRIQNYVKAKQVIEKCLQDLGKVYQDNAELALQISLSLATIYWETNDKKLDDLLANCGQII